MRPTTSSTVPSALSLNALLLGLLGLGLFELSLPTWALARSTGQATCEAPETSSWEALHKAGHAAFDRRAEGSVRGLAAREPITAAADCFRRALRAAPDRFEVRVGLLQTLLFHGEYAARTDDERRELFLEGRDLFESSYTLLSKVVQTDLRELEPEALVRTLDGCAHDSCREARPIFFLGALHWGLWADYFGNMAALRKGVAGRIRRLAEITLVVTPLIDEGGAHRLMGRLHLLAPRVPFLTSWVSRRTALRELELALAKGPDDPLNLTFLAEAAVEVAKDPTWARRLLDAAQNSVPRPEHLVEDQSAIELAATVRKKLRL